MSYTIVWPDEGMQSLRRLREDDPAGARRIAAAVMRLADDPESDTSRRLGGSPYYRLFLDDYRVLYKIEPDTNTIYITNVGIVAEPNR